MVEITPIDETQPIEADKPLPDMPFVTTSDVLNRLNKALKEQSEPGETLEPRFELQRRLPDGSSVPATKAETEYSDLQTKLQQSATFVAQLQPSDRVIWAEDQRLAGNIYFAKGDYKGAMDIYMTCLVVKEETPKFVRETLLPVLHNLAQCTLQLSMHRKTMEFCTIALEEVDKHALEDLLDPDKDPEKARLDHAIALCKIFFKRAKACRLKGDYAKARTDLNEASSVLGAPNDAAQKHQNSKDDTRKTDGAKLAPYHQAIQKEYRHLEVAEKQARKNRQRQRKAMQKALSTTKTTTVSSSTSSTNSKRRQDAADESSGTPTGSAAPSTFFGQEIRAAPRQYSTLRARKNPDHPLDPKKESTEVASNKERPVSYVEYYWTVVARVAEGLLLWLGDEETKKEVEKRID